MLTLVLTLAMLLSVMVVGAGAAFSDQDSIKNTEAVNTCNALNIINGENGSFYPTRNVTRAEMCKMICVALNGGREPALATGIGSTFTDTVGHWASPYIEYCVREGVVGGIGGGLFDPNGAVTGTQAAKMLLVAMGYNASRQGYVGSNAWELNINGDAAKNGLYDGLETIDASAALNRDNAAQIIYNALEATMVEYVYSAQTVGGTLTMVPTLKDQTYFFSSTEYKETILHAKYGAQTDKGVLTFDASNNDYDADRNEYTYGLTALPGETAPTHASYTVANDYTDLYQHHVKVLYKVDGSKTVVYGIYADESSVIASGVVGDIEEPANTTDTSVKIDGTSYKLTDAASSIDVVANLSDGTVLETLDDIDSYTATAANKAFPFDLIDNDGDNKGDIIVVYPFIVEDVDFVGTNSFSAGSTYKFEDVTVYNGIAEDDWVKITPADNTPKNTAVVEKLDEVSADASSVRNSGNEVNFGGTWFDATPSANTAVAGNSYKYVAVNGYLFSLTAGDSTVSIKDYVLATKVAADVNSTGIDTVISVQIMDTTGQKSTVNVAKCDVKTNGTMEGVAADNKPVEGDLYTYKVNKDGYHELTVAPVGANKNGFDKTIGASTVTYEKATSKDDGYIKEGATANYYINSDAVVFVKNGSDYSVTTGEKLRATNEDITSANVKYVGVKNNSSTGYGYVQLASVVTTELGKTSSEYAYVTAGVTIAKDADDDNKWYAEIPVGDGKTLTTESDANVASDVVYTAAALEKGSVIEYTLNSDGKVDDITKITMDKTTATISDGTSFAAAIIGGPEGNNLTFSKNFFSDKNGTKTTGGSPYAAKLTDDTVFIYVDSSKNTVEEGSKNLIKLASDYTIASATTKLANVYAVLDSGKNEILLLVVDINNDILNIQG